MADEDENLETEVEQELDDSAQEEGGEKKEEPSGASDGSDDSSRVLNQDEIDSLLGINEGSDSAIQKTGEMRKSALH